ncbi:MAG: ECF transporter S component [Bacillota bacterium]
MKNEKTRRITVAAMLAAVCLILNLTDLGIIPVPPAGIAIIHIPVVIGAVLEGPIVGLFLGLVFGLSSMWAAMATPMPLSPIFLDPVVAVLPRLCIPLAAYFAYRLGRRLFHRTNGGDVLAAALGAAAGTLANTLLVLSAIYLRYADKFASVMGLKPSESLGALAGIGLANGSLELIAAVIITIAVYKAVSRAYPGRSLDKTG